MILQLIMVLGVTLCVMEMSGLWEPVLNTPFAGQMEKTFAVDSGWNKQLQRPFTDFVPGNPLGGIGKSLSDFIDSFEKTEDETPEE